MGQSIDHTRLAHAMRIHRKLSELAERNFLRTVKLMSNTVEPRSTSASYEKFALRAAIRKEFCLIRRVKIRSTSDRRPSTSRGLEIRFRSL